MIAFILEIQEDYIHVSHKVAVRLFIEVGDRHQRPQCRPFDQILQ